MERHKRPTDDQHIAMPDTAAVTLGANLRRARRCLPYHRPAQPSSTRFQHSGSATYPVQHHWRPPCGGNPPHTVYRRNQHHRLQRRDRMTRAMPVAQQLPAMTPRLFNPRVAAQHIQRNDTSRRSAGRVRRRHRDHQRRRSTGLLQIDADPRATSGAVPHASGAAEPP